MEKEAFVSARSLIRRQTKRGEEEKKKKKTKVKAIQETEGSFTFKATTSSGLLFT